MNRKDFEDLIQQSPQYWRLIFCYGERLFIFDLDLDQYRVLAIQIAYEFWLRSNHE